MDETTTTIESTSTPAAGVHPARLVVFGLLSTGFLIWVLLGQVEARVWVSGQLTLLDRRIATMWRYLGDNLPPLPAAGLFSAVYWLALGFIIVGTIAGLWLILGTSDDDVDSESLESVHAAHLQHETE